MNRFYTFLALIVGLIAHNGHCMMVPKHNKPQMVKNMLKSSEPRFSEAFCAHQKMKQENPVPNFVRIDPARQFISTLAKPHNNKPKFPILTPEDEAQALYSLTDTQQFLLGLHRNDDVRLAVIRALFNGNEKVAQMCVDLPIDKTLELYQQAQQSKIYYPIIIDGKQCSEEHYAAMTTKQAYILSNSIKNGTIDASDVKGVTCTLNNLSKIDPTLMENVCAVTDEIRLYPSWSDRVSIFYLVDSVGGGGVFWGVGLYKGGMMLAGIQQNALAMLLSGDLSSSEINRVLYEWRKCGLEQGIDESVFFARCSLFGAGVSTGIVLLSKYANYKNAITQILPHQPSLTDLIKNKES